MKDLSEKELRNAPSAIQFLFAASMGNVPVPYKMLEGAIKDHPEYFPDEVEHRRKLALVPKDVDAQYSQERLDLHTEIYKDLPEGGGLVSCINNTEENQRWQTAYHECREREKPLAEALHIKHYAKYGIKWNGW